MIFHGRFEALKTQNTPLPSVEHPVTSALGGGFVKTLLYEDECLTQLSKI
jgi:hypothetical protein